MLYTSVWNYDLRKKRNERINYIWRRIQIFRLQEAKGCKILFMTSTYIFGGYNVFS